MSVGCGQTSAQVNAHFAAYIAAYIAAHIADQFAILIAGQIWSTHPELVMRKPADKLSFKK